MRSVLFDLDGTLLDTAPDFHRVISEIADQYHLPKPDYKIVRDNASNGGHAMLSGVFGAAYEDNKEAWHVDFLSLYRQTPVKTGKLFPGMDEALRWLEESAIPWGIVTNKPRDLTERVLKALNLEERCSVVVCPEDVSQAKPDPEGILKALKTVNAQAAHSLYLGDHHRDILAGQSAHTPTIACEFGYLSAEDDVNTWNASYRLAQSTELKPFLIQYFD